MLCGHYLADGNSPHYAIYSYPLTPPSFHCHVVTFGSASSSLSCPRYHCLLTPNVFIPTQAKELVETAPVLIVESMKREEAEALKATLVGHGAKVDLQ